MSIPLGSALIQIAGAALAVGAVAQVTILVVSSVRRAALDGERRRLALELLRERLEAARARQAEEAPAPHGWEGFRKFEVRRKVRECDAVCSFYLEPHDGKPLPPNRPGQFLTFRLAIPGQAKPVIRCYSLSHRGGPDHYRVTIKKVAPPPDRPDLPPGLVSTFFHDRVQVGDILDVRAPAGKFCLDVTRRAPAVLVAGGIGVTPLLSMLDALAAGGGPRETWLFLGVRNRAEHPFKDYLEDLARQPDRLHLHVCYSDPHPDDRPGRDYQHAGRVSVDLFRRLLPSNNYEFFLCGPPAMMEDVRRDLRDWGVPDDKVFLEAFGPATIRKLAAAAPGKTAEAPVTAARAAVVAPAAAAAAPALPSTAFAVHFSRSGKRLRWDPSAASLLDFALKNGVAIDSGCRAGNCMTCLTAIRSGEIRYVGRPGTMPESGSCLTCIAVPAADLVLDA